MLLSAAVIGVLTLSPGGHGASAPDGASVWQRVSCVTCPPTWLADILSNIVLFVPFGAALVLAGVAPARATLLGIVASCTVEILQLSGMPTGRAPAIADLFSNAAGAAIGAMCAHRRSVWLAPPDHVSTRLRRTWTVACGLMLVGSAMAFSPASPVRDDDTVRMSVLPFTPGYGWNTTEATEALVHGMAVPHRGTGPVIVSAARRDSGSVAVRVRGRDGRSGPVPIVFVHDPAMTTTDPGKTYAHLLLAQNGSHVSLSSDLLAGRWGLHSPSLLNRGAFAADGMNVSLRAIVTSQEWTLAWSTPNSATSEQVVTLRLSPALGWTLVQGIVTASAPASPILTSVWLLAWFAPLGFWATVGARERRPSIVGRAVLPAVCLLALGYTMAWISGTAPLSLLQSSLCLFASVAGAVMRGMEMRRPAATAAT